jgi:hypothetical protein
MAFVTLGFINTTHNNFQYFAICRRTANSLTIRAGSTYLTSGGTIHQVTGGYIHGGYNTGNQDYDVAVLQVGTDLSKLIDRAMFMLYLQ